jgi:hypothetical protein
MAAAAEKEQPSDLDIDRMVAGLGAAAEAEQDRPDNQSR